MSLSSIVINRAYKFKRHSVLQLLNTIFDEPPTSIINLDYNNDRKESLIIIFMI